MIPIPTIKPLSGRGKQISYKKLTHNLEITWGEAKFNVTKEQITHIMKNFFIDDGTWYPLGASMDQPIKGGLGEFIKENFKGLTPRHATAIAAVMENEELILVKGNKPIMLKKQSDLVDHRSSKSIKNLRNELHKNIINTWKKIKKDYDEGWLYREGTLVNAFYHHLRNDLGDDYFINNDIRIYTEFYVGTKKRVWVDMCIVKLSKDQNYFLDYLSIIEFKFLSGQASLDYFYNDVTKIKELSKEFPSTKFYIATIHEDYWQRDVYSWLSTNQRENWAKGKVTELNAFYSDETGEFVTEVVEA
ncbi:hypothetical protein [Natranaerobius thermophilus]|uniref:Uncharacterized protein n=1 Tax=Natranaerobius thermophilus (strain ATCC BAA-1301 / DSM 18059 / JW/NM-WN-LF) TaxID=457570 RepID=B2A5D0_NATTJ|nr:hypothetical protein [Natranaerobius thermophilus]ACB83964.1 hypothetical protein Nther_0368 [Natranaerobius thermophilus JW/NM-WN-LF]